MWNTIARGLCSLPGFPLPSWLKQFLAAFSEAAPLLLQPARLSIKVSSKRFFWVFFPYFDVVCILHVALESASMKSCRSGLVNMGTDASARGGKARRQPGETFYCDVKAHPSGPARRYERACTLYRVCSLNFHRLSRFRSHPVATGCISKATCNL